LSQKDFTMFDNLFSTLGQVGTLTLFGGAFAAVAGLFTVELVILLAGTPQLRRLASKSA